ncbi:hypothetical protein A3G98_00800 [Candidatus Nomurabacteria bacterium RIFCSPLOWO2_12_FULL_37_8]|uniref:Uncharacterized protein n=1 Tax=Candidatus Nomurabacteria bacterium RIFCSPLOWO2_12_FULL_37_8 TaxID=1801793 RepID=A0A1F6Y4Y6_9BACT|nr:MAG: hypothetical protein A3G98_00800 [Candidatus Nomurabacteria bacterium RIFCSPLOWO2_12_FULL_37_8]
MVFRILAFLVLLLSILFMPFWVSVILAFMGMVYFPLFLEAVFLFLLSDLLYGAREAKLGGMIFVSYIITVVVFILIEFLKKKLKFYP